LSVETPQEIVFTVPGEPVPKARARISRSGRPYLPKKTRDYQKKVALCAKAAGVKELYTGPVLVYVRFYMRNRVRKDVDNMAKSLLDGLNGVIWGDDSQVWALIASKGIDRAYPRAEVELHFLSW